MSVIMWNWPTGCSVKAKLSSSLGRMLLAIPVCCGAWFALWSVSAALLHSTILAVLFLPCGLRFSLLLFAPRFCAPAIIVAEWLVLGLLLSAIKLPAELFLLAPLSFAVLLLMQRWPVRDEWQVLLKQGGTVLLTALSSALLWLWLGGNAWQAFLASLAGCLMLGPALFILWEALTRIRWLPIGPGQRRKSFNLRLRFVLSYLLLFALSFSVQAALPAGFAFFSPLCLAVPVVLLAYLHGWRGAVLASFCNSLALAIFSHSVVNDLLLALIAQNLLGVVLGVAIQGARLRAAVLTRLNERLSRQLARNHALARQLVNAEEVVRRDVARELHDEIGQNITAIRIQATISARMTQDEALKASLGVIESLSLNVYDCARGLLLRLRPRALDDLSLQEAAGQLANELQFTERGIEFSLNWSLDELLLDEALKLTVFRVLQEALNNVTRHASASQVCVSLWQEKNWLYLSVIDNGAGTSPIQVGMGLRGMRERVETLGGKLSLSRQGGVCLRVSLPLF